MLKKYSLSILVLLSLLLGCAEEQAVGPRAVINEKIETRHGSQWADPYHYLRDDTHLDTRDYVSQEADYLGMKTSAWSRRIERLVTELNANLVVETQTYPVRSGAFSLYSEIKRGSQYPVFYRTSLSEPELTSPEVILDLNELAGSDSFYSLGGFAIDASDSIVAFTEDRVGDGRHSLKIQTINSGVISDPIAIGVGASIAWLGDSIVYINRENNSVYAYSLLDQTEILLYLEANPAFGLSVHQVDTNRITITSESHDATEIRLVNTDFSAQVIAPRVSGQRYRVQVQDELITMLTNRRAQDFELVQFWLGEQSSDWRVVSNNIAGSVVDFDSLGETLVLHTREGLVQKLMLREASGAIRDIVATSVGESIKVFSRAEAQGFLYRLNSLRQPEEIYYYDVAAHRSTRVHQAKAPANYDAEDIVVDRIWITARDQTQVPVDLIYKKVGALQERPLLISAYGAYGIERPARFDPSLLPLLDRGIVLARAYVRGGGELGSKWHHQARLGEKSKTFTDFVDATQSLTSQGYGHPDRIIAKGVSAGGTIIGVIANESPELYLGLIAEVPFVDVVNTLLDVSLPLTYSERLEWGNPEEPDDFNYLMSYSPYDRVKPQAYPNMLVLASRHDGRVGPHEALKWMARLRANNTSGSLLLIDIAENSGHLGASDQYERRRRQGLEFAFILSLLNIKD